jgi:hypothetical protein
MTSVGRSVSRSICDVEGHWLGTASMVPGLFSYATLVRYVNRRQRPLSKRCLTGRSVTAFSFVVVARRMTLDAGLICSREYSTSRQKCVQPQENGPLFFLPVFAIY